MEVLKIKSLNPDWAGEWRKDEVQRSMEGLGLDCPDGEWLEWVFDHVFDGGELKVQNELVAVIQASKGVTVRIDVDGKDQAVIEYFVV